MFSPDCYSRTLKRPITHPSVTINIGIRSSVAFLAIPNLVDISQFFIITSLGLSLGSVLAGFNGAVEEKLVRIERPDGEESM